MAKKESRALAMLAYVFWWVTGILVYLFSRGDDFARFHALQSMMAFGLLTLVQIVLIATVLGILLLPVVWLLCLIIWVLLIIKAEQGEWFKLPLIGAIAEARVLHKE